MITNNTQLSNSTHLELINPATAGKIAAVTRLRRERQPNGWQMDRGKGPSPAPRSVLE
jgi:hypothetical protein